MYEQRGSRRVNKSDKLELHSIALFISILGKWLVNDD